jgi:translation initiation factor IF-2
MSNKVRISEIAKELGRNNRDVISKAKELGITAEKHYDTVSEVDAGKIFEAIKKGLQLSSNKNNSNKRDDRRSRNYKKNSTSSENKSGRNIPKKDNRNKTLKEPIDKKDSTENINRVSRDRDYSKPKPLGIKKRKGIVVVKKSRRYIEEQRRKEEQEFLKNHQYGKLSEEARKELNSKKSNSKKNANSSNQRKKSQGSHLDIFGNREFNDNRYEEQVHEEVVVLLDYRDQSIFDDKKDEDKKELSTGKNKKNKNSKNVGRNSNYRGKQSLVKKDRKKRKKIRRDDDEVVTNVQIPEDIRVYEFAQKIKRPLADIIKVLFNLGMLVTKNDFLDKDSIEILAEEFEIEVTTIDETEAFDYVKDYDSIDEHEDDLFERASIITIMGHVDHGKTSLLDKIRDSKKNIVDNEAGGITQHIGAYTIQHNDKPITFIDTPGHSAFSAMRKRGAKITDIIIIVVAGDDGVKPQTIEAIKHAKSANVPIIVAMNKMDKEGVNPDLVKSQLAEHELNPIDWGGDTEVIPVSAKSGEGIDILLENILIQAELLELKANPNRKAKTVVIESSIEKGKGSVATVIVQNGTLKVGDNIVAGSSYGRVRSIFNDLRQPIKTLTAGETGIVIGLNSVPYAGEDLVAVDSDKEAKELAEKKRLHERNKELSVSTKATLDELSSMIAEGKLKTLKIILKTDVHGTMEAIKNTLETLRNSEVKVSIISQGIGGITENDVIHAGDSDNVVILGFNVRPTGSVKELAENRNVTLQTYTVIYDLIDDVTAMLTGMMSPVIHEENSGQAEVKQTFKVKEGVVAGCMVTDGIVERGIYARLIRNGVVRETTTILSLKRFKDEVPEVKKGYECGIILKGIDDVQIGDFIETFKKIEKQAEL